MSLQIYTFFWYSTACAKNIYQHILLRWLKTVILENVLSNFQIVISWLILVLLEYAHGVNYITIFNQERELYTWRHQSGIPHLFLIWACRRGGGKPHMVVETLYYVSTTNAHAIKFAAAPSGFTLQWRAAAEQALDSFFPFRKSPKVSNGSPPAISVAIPHARSSNLTSVPRRTTYTLVSIFSRAAIVSRTHPSQGLQRSFLTLNPWPLGD